MNHPARFHCDKLVCVGKNYLDHAKELGDAVPEMPVLFLKPPSVCTQAISSREPLLIELVRDRGSVHHECEIVVRINEHQKIDAITLGLDMTLREAQAKLKKDGHPWEVAKVFSGSALLGPWISVSDRPNYLSEEFSLWIDGKCRQRAKGIDMRLNPEACITYAAKFFPLLAGDVFFTGTPAGVDAVQVGQSAELRWNDQIVFSVKWT